MLRSWLRLLGLSALYGSCAKHRSRRGLRRRFWGRVLGSSHSLLWFDCIDISIASQPGDLLRQPANDVVRCGVDGEECVTRKPKASSRDWGDVTSDTTALSVGVGFFVCGVFVGLGKHRSAAAIGTEVDWMVD